MTDVALPTITAIELCAGVGMLGEGVRAAFELYGRELRTICYVEREAPAAAQLVRLMEAGALDQAPVWSDLLTFDSAAWRGCVDLLIAGFPCQDISIAGKRAGLDGKRSGLFFNILDIADACSVSGLVLENVSAIATATATAVDEAEGTLEERAAARVVGELADRGWDAEWITLSASDVGASHGRARWFCLAWRRVADTGHGPRAGHPLGIGRCGEPADDCAGGEAMGNAERTRWKKAGRRPEEHPGREPEPRCGDVDDRAGAALADPTRHGWHQGRPESGGQQGRSDAAECCGAMADAGCAGLEGRRQSRDSARWEEPHGHVGLEGGSLFAPGPLSTRWAAIVANRPDLAPAVEPGVRMLADGMAYLVDESRAHQLRQVGNGVVPLQAAAAVVELLRRAHPSTVTP